MARSCGLPAVGRGRSSAIAPNCPSRTTLISGSSEATACSVRGSGWFLFREDDLFGRRLCTEIHHGSWAAAAAGPDHGRDGPHWSQLDRRLSTRFRFNLGSSSSGSWSPRRAGCTPSLLRSRLSKVRQRRKLTPKFPKRNLQRAAELDDNPKVREEDESTTRRMIQRKRRYQRQKGAQKRREDSSRWNDRSDVSPSVRNSLALESYQLGKLLRIRDFYAHLRVECCLLSSNSR